MSAPKLVYQLKVTLKDTKPSVWRRVVVPENITLASLHEILQVVMGWEDYHLHQFIIAGQFFGNPEDDEFGELDLQDEARARLNRLGLGEDARFSYEYDFGDSWDHTLVIEKILPAEKGVRYPVCIAGKRACPPEDVGGVWGYAEFLEAIANPRHEEHTSYLEWIGGRFDPDEFDLEVVNADLRAMKTTSRGKGAYAKPEDGDDAEPADEDIRVLAAQAPAWVQGLSREQAEALEALPLRRDTLAFLDYLSKNRTVGTQATGNLPLKAVRAICEKFVNPPALDTTIGDQVFKLRSEDEVWPLYFIHNLAFQTGLVVGGAARTWKATSAVPLFLQSPPSLQVLELFVHWFVDADWTIAFPVSGLANGLPPQFRKAALAALQSLPVGEAVPFDPFADRLIAQVGLVWPIQDQTFAHSILQSVVRRTLVEPMMDFGVLTGEYGTDKFPGLGIRDLLTICLTPVGKGMLGLLG